MKKSIFLFALILMLFAVCFELTACGEDNAISFKTLEANGTDVYGRVTNDQTTFSFVDEIKVFGNAKFVVALDELGMQTVATKTVSLKPGENTFYIIETVNNEATAVYAVVIHRNLLYTVSFDAEGVSAAEAQYIEEGGFAKEPTMNIATPLGYEFLGWSFDFSKPITENVVVKAKIEACEEMKNFEFTSSDTTCVITGLKDETVTEIIIPDYVTGIGNGAFNHCESLTSVTIPDSVTAIDSFAFAYCEGLTSITVPDNVTSIGDNAFSQCKKLKSITLGNGITSIGSRAFEGCDSLVSVTIPDSVTKIHPYAFSSCDNLSSVTIGSGVSNIYDYAFQYCYRLVEVINNSFSAYLDIEPGSSSNGGVACYAIEVHRGESKINSVDDYLFYTFEGINYLVGYVGENMDLILPESYKRENYEIYKYAFYMRHDITSVTIGNGITTVGDYAFRHCRSLASVTIGNGVTSIGEYAFANCTGLTCVTIGNGVTRIGEYAFSDCTALTCVAIPDNVVAIEEGAFCRCRSLTSVTIPGSVTSIGNGVFSGCTSLTIYCEASSQPDGWAYYWNYSDCPVVWGYTG